MPQYIAEWFPFSVEEIATAFEAMGVAPVQARRDAEQLASDVIEGDQVHGVFGVSEMGGFLDPVARLSEDAAKRVAAFRAHRPYKGGSDL